MNRLDDNLAIHRVDKAGTLKRLEYFPDQCQEAYLIAEAFKADSLKGRRFKNIVIAGLGGSAIGGDLLRSYVSDEANIPIFVNRTYALPAFVNKHTLVIASSYSGNTEETISAYKDARKKKAARLVITSGGALEGMARSDKTPCIKIPGGLPPRCALGYSFFPMLVLLAKLGIVKDKREEIKSTIKLMRELEDRAIGAHVSSDANIAKKIAFKIHKKFVVIYSSQNRVEACAVRLRSQLAENSKTLSSTNFFPELTHNEIVGWEYPKKLLKECVVIILRDMEDSPRVEKRMDISRRIIEKERVHVIEIASSGRSLLERIFSLVHIGDFISFYLAILNNVDPAPVARIDYLKKELAKS